MAPGNSDSINILTRSSRTTKTNIESAPVTAAKGFDTVITRSVAGTVSRGATFLRENRRSTIDVQGDIIGTGVPSDMAIDGHGMLVVSDEKGQSVFTRMGDFRQTELGFWENGGKKRLMAWRLDNNGALPQDNSLLTSLEAVNFANTKGEPRATTAISLSMNLNADQEGIRGAGPLLSAQRTGLNSNITSQSPEKILFPEITRSGGLQLGDTFDIQSIPPSTLKTLEFGGMTVGRAPTSNRAIAGATNINAGFTFGNNAGEMPVGGTLKITVGGNTSNSYVFTAKQSGADTSNREFSSISGLVEAINKISALNASTDNKGNIHIGTTDPNVSMQFIDGNGSTLAKQLGLYDIAAVNNPETRSRFNSLTTLQQAVNKGNKDTKLKATIESGNISITSLNATNDFQMTTTSLGKHRIRHATLGDGTEKGAGTVTITAPNNGLAAGDYVKLENAGGKLPDGVYYVSTANEREFQVSIVINDASAASPVAGLGDPTNGYPVSINTQDIIDFNADIVNSPTWTKMAGASGSSNNSATITAANAGTGLVTINVAAGFNVADDDVVYISGAGIVTSGADTIEISDGYYRVQNYNGGANTIDVQSTGVLAAPPPAGTPSTLSVTNIGHTTGADFVAAPISTKVVETFAAPNDNFVRIHIPNHNYSKDDFIAFQGLPDAYAIGGGASLKNDFKYKVINADPNRNYVDIEALDANDNPVLVAAASAGAYQTHGNAAFAAPEVGTDFRINYFSRTLEYFNTSPNQQETRNLNDLFEKSYNKDDVQKSLASGTFGTKTVFEQTLQGFDSVGAKYNLQLRFAKLENRIWAVEVMGIKEDDGTFNVQAPNQRADGYIAGGTIEFAEDGTFRAANGINQQITFTTKSGAAPVSITIDWENELGDIENGSVTQYARDNNFEFIQNNGQAAGVLSNISITEDGIIVGTYDSGETRDLYRIPIATFPNINGLIEGADGTYTVSRESGELLLKSAGANGAGKTISNSLESSNIDSTAQLLKSKEEANNIQSVARVISTEFSNQKTILNEIQ